MAPSSVHLIVANAFTLALALIFDWDAGWLLWPYWVQSVVIGWYARKRMLALDKFSTKGFTSGGKPVPEDESGKRSTANFFAFHYGFFHVGYLVFLISHHPIARAYDVLLLLACGLSFVFSQRATYAVQHAADLRGRPNLSKMMATPYLRIVPMHFALIFIGGSGMMILFTALKTASDLALDAIDRRIASATAGRASGSATSE